MNQNYVQNQYNQPQSVLGYQTRPESFLYNQSNGQKRLNQLYRYYQPNFPPYQTYFTPKQYHITLYRAQPKKYIHSNFYNRQRLCIQRQVMYYRGAVDEYLDDGILEEYIGNSLKEKGFVYKKGKKSLITNGILIYGHESTIRAIEIPRMQNSNKLQVYQQSLEPLLIVDFGTGNTILELQSLQNHYLNTIYQGTILKVRFARKIVLFSIKQRKNISTLQSSTEFTQVNHSIYAKNTLQTMEYNGQATIISIYQLEHKQDQFITNFKESLKIQGLVNNKITLNRNQLLLTKYEGIYLFDKRTPKLAQIYRLNNPTNQKLYNSIPLKGNYNFSPLIVNCHSRHLSIFDIRKPNQFIKIYPHHCEESPPLIMNFYDGNSLSCLEKPIIACHSPYSLGSSLFLSLNLQNFEGLNIAQRDQIQYQKSTSQNIHFTLLYDKGKSTKESGLHRYFNESLAIWNQSPEIFSVFKVDNEGSLGIQTFTYNQISGKYHPREFYSEQPFFLALNTNQINSSQAQLQQSMISKYFLKQAIYKQIAQIEVNNQISLSNNKKKVSKRTKSKIKSKSQRKISKLKQRQTEVDLKDFQDAEYQNSSECPQSLSKRKVNFADLTQFYSVLQKKANHPKPQTQNKHHHVDLSLSTQANSQGFSFSQILDIDTGIKALSFHNKKLMNYSILEKLKNDWDN